MGWRLKSFFYLEEKISKWRNWSGRNWFFWPPLTYAYALCLARLFRLARDKFTQHLDGFYTRRLANNWFLQFNSMLCTSGRLKSGIKSHNDATKHLTIKLTMIMIVRCGCMTRSIGAIKSSRYRPLPYKNCLYYSMLSQESLSRIVHTVFLKF